MGPPMPRLLCPCCNLPTQWNEMRTFRNKRMCAVCADFEAFKAPEPEPPHVLDRYPKAPRPVTEAVREAYLRQDHVHRGILFAAGFFLLAGGLFVMLIHPVFDLTYPESRSRAADWAIQAVLLAAGGLLAFVLHRLLSERRLRIYRKGDFVLAEEALRIEIFRSEAFDQITDWLNVGRAWMVLRLHLGVIYLARLPGDPRWHVLQMAPDTAPWYVKGKLVVCRLPDSPGRVVLVPAEVGVRLAAATLVHGK
ncbi:MAG: hypothetical protein L6R28_15345 [Planctomycetes bacterium]|nr:hypothetical protein [Planctomycetota bacterium]